MIEEQEQQEAENLDNKLISDIKNYAKVHPRRSGLLAVLVAGFSLLIISAASGSAPKEAMITNPKPTPTNLKPDITSFSLHNPASTSASNRQKELSATDPTKADTLKAITGQPTSVWLTKSINDIDVYIDTIIKQAEAQNEVPVFVVYNIPLRYCEGGGADTISEYKSWVAKVAKAINNRRAISVIEPDSLALLDCLDETQQSIRIEGLSFAVQAITEMDNQYVYIDAGHSDWVPVQEMTDRLQRVGIESADGFTLNVSNFQTNEELLRFGDELRASLGGNKNYLIDSSRNGNGPDGKDWCNPRGRALGKLPTFDTNHEGLDAYLWIKFPGESDGACNGGPSEGAWWDEYAFELIDNSPY